MLVSCDPGRTLSLTNQTQCSTTKLLRLRSGHTELLPSDSSSQDKCPENRGRPHQWQAHVVSFSALVNRLATPEICFATRFMLPTVMALSFVDKLGELLVCSSSTRVPLQGLRSG